MRGPALIGLAVIVASCGERADQPYVDQLVERFEVDECAQASLVRAGRNPDESKPGGKSVYIVDDGCIADMERAFAVIGFEERADGSYRYTSTQGWYEDVTLTRADDQQQAGIEWETIEP